jgi:hypothetical protein
MAAVQNWEKKKEKKPVLCTIRNRNNRPPAVIRAAFRIYNHGSQKKIEDLFLVGNHHSQTN